MVSEENIKILFEEHLVMMTGGVEHVTYGTARWIELIRGKNVFAQLINGSGFKVIDAEGRELSGDDKAREIVEDLVVKDIASRPPDFGELRLLLEDLVVE